MKRIRTIHTTQKLDDQGRIGAWMFMLSPLAGGICYAWYLSSLTSYRSDHVVPAIMMVACGLAFLGGAILLLVGRTQTHTLYADEPAPESAVKPLWS